MVTDKSSFSFYNLIMQNHDVPELNEEELNRKLDEGYKCLIEGKGIPFDEAMKRIRKKSHLDGEKINPKNLCKNCTWFVNETSTIGDYNHEEALKQQKGFCLSRDFFTYVDLEDETCEDFNNDNK